MSKRELNGLTDQELLDEAKKAKSAAIIDAALIGFLIGVVVYSVINNTWGFLMLIPLFLAYKLFNKPRHNARELEALLRERNLK
ncbi:MAG: hypothetical protein ACO1NS_12595 [Daejeonella sp.]